MDKDVLLSKLESLRRCVQRVRDKRPPSVESLIADYDRQDIIVLNLERAVQICVDIGLHLLSALETPVPDTMAQVFTALQRAGCISELTAERMIKAVGFRNTAVHAYQEIDWTIVYRIATEHLDDFREFAKEIVKAAES